MTCAPHRRLAPRFPARRALALAVLVAPGWASARPAAPEEPAPPYGPMLLESAQGERLLEEGQGHLLALRLGAADSAFARLDALEPQSPAGAYGRATAALWRALLQEQDAAIARFFALADTFGARVDAVPDADGEAGVWRAFFEGEAALQRAIVLGRQERYTPAALAFRRACGSFRDALRRRPDFEEAHLGVGVCEVAAGAIPRKYRWVARLLGFSGTLQGGLDGLERAGAHARYVRETAVVVRAIVEAALDRAEADGMADVAALAQAHPESPIAALAHGYLLSRMRRVEEAAAAFAVAARPAAPGVEPVLVADAQLGLALFRLNRFDEAARHLDRYLRSYRGSALVATSRLHLGLAREMVGDRAGAEAAYRMVRARRELDVDHATEREAQRRLRRPMTAHERALVLGQTAFDTGRYRDAVAAVQPVLDDPAAEASAFAEAAYRAGRAYQALREWAEAERHYGLAIARPGDPRARWGPWSRYHLGEVQEARGDSEAARQTYRAALDDEAEFDYYQALEQRARAALERL